MSLMGYTETDIIRMRSSLNYTIELITKLGIGNDFTAILPEVDEFLEGLLIEGRV